MLCNIINIVALVVVGVVLPLLICLNNIHILQQNSYRNSRYRRWFSLKNYLSTFKWVRKQKLPLVYTPRVKRLITTCVILIILIQAGLVLLTQNMYCGYLLAVFAFLIVQAANVLNAPIEKSIAQGYYNDAKRILESMPNLTIVAVTGSYGKTSTKHYLHKILSEKFITLMTPGSFNTTLGVVRTIREHLKPYHQVFIVEMGAKQVGDIEEICKLVNPSIGIITAVAEQHMETFHSLENVLKTKFELAESLPADGLLAINNDFPAIAENHRQYKCRTIRYSQTQADVHLRNISYTSSGAQFEVVAKDWSIELKTSLVGRYNLSNLTASVIVAKELGLTDQQIKIGVSRVEQVEHRLSIKRQPSGITIIDDAFNSNPYGAQMALEVLSGFPSKRIVVTPGMIELGDKQFEENKKFGVQIARSADIAIVVNKVNADAITEGLREGGMEHSKIMVAKNLFEATTILNKISAAGDTILYENDLPDMFK